MWNKKEMVLAKFQSHFFFVTWAVQINDYLIP